MKMGRMDFAFPLRYSLTPPAEHEEGQ